MSCFKFGIDFQVESCEKNEGSCSKTICDEDIMAYISDQKAKSTKPKESSDYSQFKRFCKSIDESREIYQMKEAELDNILCQFYMNAKTIKVGVYEPDTLTGFKNSLQRIINERNIKHDLNLGIAFTKSRMVLKSRRKQLTKLGKGNIGSRN